MGTTDEFVKLRSAGTPKTGEWNVNYERALALAKKEGKFIVTCWSNGDLCSYCRTAETCMMDPVFTGWMKKADAYFVFQYSGDKDKGKTLWNWLFKDGKIKTYPGFRITRYDAGGNIVSDTPTDGNTLRKNKSKTAGAQNMVAALSDIISKGCGTCGANQANDYKVRLNEKLTVKKVNAVLDAIDANGGYCPCQPKSAATKCHCEDFVKNKKIGEPCICKIYVKQKKA